MACLVLLGVGLRFLVAAWSPAQGRHTLEITVGVLQHMDKFMADQLAAHLRAHRSLLQADGAQAAVLRPVAGVFTREFGWARDHLHPQALAFPQELFPDGWIGAAGAASTLGGGRVWFYGAVA
jgi:hypothetical protein